MKVECNFILFYNPLFFPLFPVFYNLIHTMKIIHYPITLHNECLTHVGILQCRILKFKCTAHRVDRVLGFFSSRPKFGLPHPFTRRRVCPPFYSSGEGTHSLAGGSGGVPIPTRGQTLWYSRYIFTLWYCHTSWWIYRYATITAISGVPCFGNNFFCQSQ